MAYKEWYKNGLEEILVKESPKIENENENEVNNEDLSPLKQNQHNYLEMQKLQQVATKTKTP